MSKIAIVGSINTDFVFRAKNLPLPSETISGDSFNINFGGKGANEAVALARLGSTVSLFGAVGNDIFSVENIKNLKKEKVNIKNIKTFSDISGGAAGIAVGSGTNSIIVVPGANNKVDEAYLEKIKPLLMEYDVIGTQLEIPLQTVKNLIMFAKNNGKTLIFNPSPMITLSQKLLDDCGYIVVNEIEIKQLPNYKSDSQLIKRYKGKLILTRGSEGVYYWDERLSRVHNIPSLKIKTLDTTGAGDTFLAAFMHAISKKGPLEESLAFANICAGLKVSKCGAQTGMPTIKEVNRFIAKSK